MADKEEFVTGSVRDTREGKGRYDLIPSHPLFRLARRYEEGCANYGERNWERGQKAMRYLDSCFRHLANLIGGDQKEDNAAAVAWNIFGFMHTLREIEEGRLPAELDDRPARMKKETIEVKPKVPPARTAEEVNRSFVRLRDGFLANVGAWLTGGCAWCGGADRLGLPYVHDDCLSLIMTPGMPSGLFNELATACDAAGEKK